MRLQTMAVALAAALLASACQEQAPRDSGSDAAMATGADADAGAAPDGAVSRSGADAQAAADRALREGRLYAPAGDSAIEYWLEARAREPGDTAVESAIVELQPYLLIGCEQAIARHDFEEARRLHGLIAASNPDAPALQRLEAAITSAEAESGRAEAVRLAAEEARRQREEAEARTAAMARTAAAQVAAAQAAAARTPAQPSPAPEPATAQVTAQAPADEVPGTALPPMAMPAVTPVAGGPAPQRSAAARPATPPPAPRLLHQPAPRYPPVALSRRIEGAVQVGFTIRPDGSVDGARVVSADPPGVFDRSALAAVSGYRFEPAGQAIASVITVRFALE